MNNCTGTSIGAEAGSIREDYKLAQDYEIETILYGLY